MQNYHLLMERLLRADGEHPKLLLHSCCAPCSSYVLEYLAKYFFITVFYSNSNIDTEPEFEKRLSNQNKLCGLHGIRLIEDSYDHSAFLAAGGLENEAEGGARCTECFKMRLGRAVEFAAENGFEYVATTLTVSPHKNAAVINEIGCSLADKAGVKWLPSDFKKRGGYQRSIELSHQLDLYRQNYCGCEFAKGHPQKSLKSF